MYIYECIYTRIQVSLEEAKVAAPTSHLTHHMIASDVDVKRVEDEVEDPLELLKEYYESFVLPLAHTTPTDASDSGNPTAYGGGRGASQA